MARKAKKREAAMTALSAEQILESLSKIVQAATQQAPMNGAGSVRREKSRPKTRSSKLSDLPAPSPIDLADAERALIQPATEFSSQPQFDTPGGYSRAGSYNGQDATILDDPRNITDIPATRENFMSLLGQVNSKLEVLVNFYKKMNVEIMSNTARLNALEGGRR